MSWFYKDQLFTEQQIGNNVGFIYQITEISTNKKYIGQKVFFNKIAKKPLKGKVKRRITKKQSDWQTYYGSNDILNQLVEQIGTDKFKREIIRLCKSKSEMNYWETYYIFNTHSLLRDDYFNNWASCRINRNQLAKVEYED